MGVVDHESVSRDAASLLLFVFLFAPPRFLSFLHASHDIDTTYADSGDGVCQQFEHGVGCYCATATYGLKSLVTVSYYYGL